MAGGKRKRKYTRRQTTTVNTSTGVVDLFLQEQKKRDPQLHDLRRKLDRRVSSVENQAQETSAKTTGDNYRPGYRPGKYESDMPEHDIHTARAIRDGVSRVEAKRLNYAEAYGRNQETVGMSLNEDDPDFKMQVEALMKLPKLSLAIMAVKLDRKLYNQHRDVAALLQSHSQELSRRTPEQQLEREQGRRWRAGLNIIKGVLDNLT